MPLIQYRLAIDTTETPAHVTPDLLQTLIANNWKRAGLNYTRVEVTPIPAQPDQLTKIAAAPAPQVDAVFTTEHLLKLMRESLVSETEADAESEAYRHVERAYEDLLLSLVQLTGNHGARMLTRHALTSGLFS